jgi:hypothetical protein
MGEFVLLLKEGMYPSVEILLAFPSFTKTYKKISSKS